MRASRLRCLAAPAAAVLLGLIACGDDAEDTETVAPDTAGVAIGDAPCPQPDGTEERTVEFDTGPQACIDPEASYEATLATSRGDIAIALDAAAAPMAVNNFVFLARHRFYDGTEFHRIIPGFVVQGGDPGTGTLGEGGPGYEFVDEAPADGPPFYAVGSVAMANAGPDTNGSQFFIVTGPEGEQLPPSYTRFGEVTDGMDVVAELEATGTSDGTPSERTTIDSVTITEG
jgi:cyclophilin family peptidyl-prolyl cis-trans isomerase